MDDNDIQLTAATARWGYESALADPLSPEETAERLKSARAMGVPDGLSTALTREQINSARSQAEDWNQIAKTAPVTASKMRDPVFALMTKDKPRELPFVESLAWKIAPDGPEKGTAHAAMARGMFNLSATMQAANVRALIGEVSKYEKQKAMLAEGKTQAEVFGTDDDPNGEIGRIALDVYQKDPSIILGKIYQAFRNINAAREGAARFPMSEAVQKFFENGGDWQETVKAFGANWVDIVKEGGIESLVQNAPTIATMMGASLMPGLGSLPAGMASTYLSSKAMESNSEYLEGILDLVKGNADPEVVLRAIMDPANAKAIQEAEAKAHLKGVGVGAVDALSLGLAGKLGFLEKPLGKIGNPLLRGGLKGAAELQAQGLMGAGGEVLGQVLSEGKVTNWADVMAEYAGEHFTGTFDVATAAVSHARETQVQKQTAERNANVLRELNKSLSSSAVAQRDLKTTAEILDATKATITLDGGALAQEQVEKIKQAMPERAQEIDTAIAEGGAVEMPLSDFALKVMPAAGDEIVELASVNGSLSQVEAQIQADAVSQQVTDRLLEQQIQDRANDPTFKAELKEVHDFIVQEMKDAYQVSKDEKKDGVRMSNPMPDDQIHADALLMTTHVSNMARDADMSPKEVWDLWGAKGFLGMKDVKRDANGKIIAVSDKAKNLASLTKDALYQLAGLTPEDREVLDLISYEAETPVRKTPESKKIISVAEDRLRNELKELKKTAPIKKGQEAVPLIAQDGFIAGFSNNSIEKMVCGKSSDKVSEDYLHANVVANAIKLFERSVPLWDHPGNKEEDKKSIKQIRRRGSIFILDGIPYFVKMTIREHLDKGTLSRYYTIEAIEATDAASIHNWAGSESSHDKASRRYHVHENIIANAFEKLYKLSRESAENNKSEDPDSLKQSSLGEFLPDSRTIIRWANANASTILHEGGHLFLEMRLGLADKLLASGKPLNAAQQRLVDTIVQTVRWLGKDKFANATDQEVMDFWRNASLDEKRDMHEQFARTYEAYLMTGRAPTKGLQALFRKFTQWLRSIYTAIANVPGAKLDASVIELYDNLFTTFSEIEEARLRRKTFEALNLNGMSLKDDEIEAAAQEQVDLATEELLAKRSNMFERLRRLREAKAKAIAREDERFKKGIEKEEKEKFWNSKIGQALKVLRNGVVDSQGKRHLVGLPLQGLKDLGVSDSDIELLKKHRYVDVKSKLDGDQLASAMGYTSMDELVRELIPNADPKKVIEANTDARLVNEWDSAWAEEAKKAADLALINEGAVTLAAMGLKVFDKANRKVNRVRGLRKELRVIAEAQLGTTKVKDLDPLAINRQAVRADRRIFEALKKGNVEEAIRAARQKLFQEIKALVAKKAQQDVEKAMKRFNRIQGRSQVEGLEQKYLTQIQSILVKMGIPLKRGLALDTVSFDKFLEDLRKAGSIEPNVSDDLKALIDSPLPVNINELPYDIFAELNNLVNDMVRLGRAERLITIDDEIFNRADVQNNLVNGILEGAKQNGIKERKEADGDVSGARKWLRNFTCSHWRIPSLLRAIEGKRDGFFYKYVIAPGDKCAGKEAALKAEYTKKMYDAFKPLLKDLRKKSARVRKYYPTLGISLSKQEVMAIALNLGNEDNILRVVDGLKVDQVRNPNGVPVTADQLIELVGQTLTGEQIRSIQAIWDAVGGLRPEIHAKELRVYGRPPVWVEPKDVTFTTAKGEVINLKGGYYPIAYDPVQSDKAEAQNSTTNLKQAMQGQWRSSQASRGHLKTRAKRGMNAPLSLTLEAGFRGLDNTIHELCWQEWEINCNKIFGLDGPVSNAIKAYWGKESTTAIAEWLKDIAVGNAGMFRQGDAVFTFLSKNVSLAGLGFNVLSAMVQPVALIQSAAVIGTQWLGRGIAICTKMGPLGAYRFACEHSNEMANRGRTRFRELVEVESMAMGGNPLLRAYQNGAYKMIVVMQALADLPTWYGAREKALKEGKTEVEANALADRAVKDAQGSGDVFELSGVERGHAAAKILSVFYTFFNTTLNAARLSKNTESFARHAFNMLLMMAFQPMAETFLREVVKAMITGDLDDDEWLKKVGAASVGGILDFQLGLFVGLRELNGLGEKTANWISGEKGTPTSYRGPSGTRKVQDFYALYSKLPKIAEGDIDLSVVKALNNALGSFIGIPSAQINKTLSGADALMKGKTDNPMAIFFGYSDKW